MLFSSIPFLYFFLPIVLILYFAVPKVAKNVVLLVASLVFYAWGEPKYVILMTASIILGYIFGLLIEKNRGKKSAKVYLILSVVSSLLILGFFKYSDFFIANFSKVFGIDAKLLGIALPIGISFYTFQILSYTVDVYRGEAAQKNPINLATYVALFPQLIAGPIVRYSDIAKELDNREHSVSNFAEGMSRFVIGLGKKVLIANMLGELCDTFKSSNEKTVLFYWIYAIAYTLHIYFDFSGYSDMAIGLGRIFGFHFLENFNYPYISKSITEFWRRWHMSLGSWFRDYVYIPLGGNRVSKARWFLNIMIVWMLTGFWHGANWNFIVWGLYFGIFLIIEKVFLYKHLEKLKVLNHIYVLFFIIISFVIFDGTSMGQIVSYIGGMFGAGGISFVNATTLYELRNYLVVIILGIIGATPLVKNTVLKIKTNAVGEKIINVLEPIALILLVTIITANLVDGSFNPFLYFRF